MSRLPNPEKYSLTIRLLHWIMALVIVGLLVLGIFMTPFDMGNPHLSEKLYFWHKSFGMLIMFLILGRILVRLNADIQELPRGMALIERRLAKTSHILLYVLMMLVPFTGYLDSSAFPDSSGVHFFFMDIPDLVDKDEALSKIANLLHKIFAYTLAGTIVLHIAGALKHRFFDRENDVLNRIL